ncbi:MAG: alpha/beta hydrolase [Erysipelotrichaceae bacterium]|nr:alpha/beta hydrolase [Erysipelotrichaceae bacterium]
MKIILIVLFLLLVIASLAAGYYIFNSVFLYNDQNKGDKDSALDPSSIDSETDLMRPTAGRYYAFRAPYIDAFNELDLKELTIKSFDNLTLYGYLLEGDPKEVVICVHGYKSSMEEDFADRIRIYQERGSTVLLLNDRAHGKSEGKYLGFSENDKRDVARWVTLVNQMYDDPKIYLHGVSMGGATVIHCANEHLENVCGIIDDCGFDSIVNISKYLIKDIYHLPYFPFGDLAWFWSVIITGVSFNTSMGEKCVEESNVPIVFIHGKEDHFVPCYMSEKMYEACRSPKELLLVDGCGHAAAYMMATKEYTALVNKLLDGEIK